MNDVVEFVWNNHNGIREGMKLEQLENFLTIMSDRIIVMRNKEGNINCIGSYYKLLFKTFKNIGKGLLDPNKEDVSKVCLKENGRYIYFFLVISKSMKVTKEAIRKVIAKERPIKIGWHYPDMNRWHEYNQ